VASYTNTAPDQVASDDGIAAIVLSIDMTYTVSLAAIARINVMLASMGSSSAADNTIMGGKTAQKKPSAVDENRPRFVELFSISITILLVIICINLSRDFLLKL
jgi:hypothetical protein